MLVTVLYRMAGSPDVEGKVSEKFKDCKDGAYYEKAVLWAAANGIVGGYSNGTFKPTNPVNRQELAKILYGYDVFAKRVGQDFAVELTYTDLDSIPDWALEAVNYCSAAGYPYHTRKSVGFQHLNVFFRISIFPFGMDEMRSVYLDRE